MQIIEFSAQHSMSDSSEIFNHVLIEFLTPENVQSNTQLSDCCLQWQCTIICYGLPSFTEEE